MVNQKDITVSKLFCQYWYNYVMTKPVYVNCHVVRTGLKYDCTVLYSWYHHIFANDLNKHNVRIADTFKRFIQTIEKSN